MDILWRHAEKPQETLFLTGRYRWEPEPGGWVYKAEQFKDENNNDTDEGTELIVDAKTKKTKAQWDTWRPRIRRADIRTPSDSGKTAELLQAEIDQAPPTPQGPPRRAVARSAIHIAEKVFQWRGDPRKDQWTRENHIHTLAKALRDREEPLDRLLVMPVGVSFYVIDGHHRLAAYDTAGWTNGIPVEVFTGSLTEARVRALASNVKDKLPMTAQAKSEAAWKITKENLGGLKPDRVVELTGVSKRQVQYMRKAWHELNEREGADRAGLMELTWVKARVLWQTGEEMSSTDFDQDAWREKKAQEVVDLMQRTNVAAGIMKDVEVTALALQRLSADLPQALIEQWAGDYPELIEELAARIANPGPDEEF